MIFLSRLEPLNIHIRKLLFMYCPGHAGVYVNDRADRLAGKAITDKWLASQKICVEELETLHVGTQPSISHHRLPGGERHREMREGHCQSDEHWNCLSRKVHWETETFERPGNGLFHMYIYIYIILN